MSSGTFLLTPGNLPDYLAGCRLAGKSDSISVTELGGGVSNIVLLAEGPGFRWVVKQALEKLRVKDDWRSERSRVFREAEAIQALRPLLGEAAVPEVIHTDRENFLFVMTAAPVGSTVWKDLLLGRRADSAVARQAALLLARMINGSRADPAFQKRFWDGTVFDQLRIDPYYRTTAARHPDVREHYDELIGTSKNIQTAAVHGDYSPKNMLVRRSNIFLVDFEVIHWGDPAFDSGFLLNHLFLKTFHQPRFGAEYIGLAREFWKTLLSALALGAQGASDFERMTVLHLGGLMLARVDGKSPVEYITDVPTQEKVRKTAKRILRERPRHVEEVIGLVLSETAVSPSGGAAPAP